MKEKEIKIGIIKNDKMGAYELEQGFASYRTIVNQFIGDCVLCNNIISIDESVFYNMEGCEEEREIFQYYLCDLSDFEKSLCLNSGLILSYSDMLECDVLCVDHFGSSWDIVLTDVKICENYEKLKEYEGSSFDE